MSAPLPTVPIEGVVYTIREWGVALWAIRDHVPNDTPFRRDLREELAQLYARMQRYADRLENEAAGWPASPRSSDGLGGEKEVRS